MTPKCAIYPGTFDPFTNGHLDLVKRGLTMFDEIIVAVAASLNKNPLFSVRERLEMIEASLKSYSRTSVESFDTLLVDFVKKKRGIAIIRGLRAISDFEYELQMAVMNRRLYPKIETVFMMPNEEYSFLSSTIVKEIALLNGDIQNLVPKPVYESLKNKFE